MQKRRLEIQPVRPSTPTLPVQSVQRCPNTCWRHPATTSAPTATRSRANRARCRCVACSTIASIPHAMFFLAVRLCSVMPLKICGCCFARHCLRCRCAPATSWITTLTSWRYGPVQHPARPRPSPSSAALTAAPARTSTAARGCPRSPTGPVSGVALTECLKNFKQ